MWRWGVRTPNLVEKSFFVFWAAEAKGDAVDEVPLTCFLMRLVSGVALLGGTCVTQVSEGRLGTQLAGE